MIKISIIVPVYNVEKYVERCLLSLINQTLKDIEIIVINDGSTDDSEKIIQNFCKIDSRIKYIYQNNIGVGQTRNKGISISEGEYIGFVDPDDSVNVEMFEKLYTYAKENDSDISICSSNTILNDDQYIKDQNNEKRILTEKNVNSNIKYFIKNYYCTNIYENHSWDKIYKRTTIVNNNVQFGDLNEITGEDTFFVMVALLYSNIVTFTNEKLYNYNLRDNSIMNTYNPQKMKKTINFIKKLDDYQKKNGQAGKLDSFLSMYIYNLCVASSNEFLKNNKKSDLLDSIKYMINDDTAQKFAKKLLTEKYYLMFTGIKRLFSKSLSEFIVKKKIKLTYCLLMLKYYMK